MYIETIKCFVFFLLLNRSFIVAIEGGSTYFVFEVMYFRFCQIKLICINAAICDLYMITAKTAKTSGNFCLKYE